MSRAMPPRGLLFLLALGYSVFVVYGSLVPLDFKVIPFDEAVARFREIRWLALGVGSRADWVANLLLFVPLAFLWMAVLAAGRGWGAGVFATLLVVPVATLASLGIEFTQLYFPQRTVSQNDIFAETVGAVLGVVLWWTIGARLVDWIGGWVGERARANLPERLAWTYLAGLALYNVMPLDLTISVVEIFHKWQEGRVHLLPFASLPGFGVEGLYEIATDILIWTPLAWLWRQSGKSRSRAFAFTLAAALLLEFLQLFVWSRVSDSTDIVAAALGAAIACVPRERVASHAEAASGSIMRLALPLALAFGYAVVLVAVFWYPYEFRTDGVFLRERLATFFGRVPFEAYYFGTEFRAITEVLHKLLFFIPLGALLAAFVVRLPWVWRGWGAAFAAVCVLAVSVAVVIGRIAQPDKHPDSVDAFLQAAGAAIGYVVFKLAAPRPPPIRTLSDQRAASGQYAGSDALRPSRRRRRSVPVPVE